MTDTVPGRRWYDQHPDVHRVATQMPKLPKPVQSVFSRQVLEFVARNRFLTKLTQSYNQLGRERVLALHKAQLCRRELDEDPQVRQFFKQLLLLERAALDTVSDKSAKTIDQIHSYLDCCRRYGQPEKLDVVARVAWLALERTDDQVCQTYLERMEEEFRILSSKPEDETIVLKKAPSSDSEQIIQASSSIRIAKAGSDMKITDAGL